MQTSEFSDLASEAQALSRQLFDSGKMEAVSADVLEGVQFVDEASRSQSQEHHRAPVKPTDRRLLDTGSVLDKMQKSISHMVEKEPKKYNWSHCPYCDAPAEPGVRFCLNCQQKFISPEEAAKLQYANQDDMDQGTRGFSARAKKATAAGGSMAMIQWVIGVLLLVSAAVMVAVGYKSGALGHYISGVGFAGDLPRQAVYLALARTAARMEQLGMAQMGQTKTAKILRMPVTKKSLRKQAPPETLPGDREGAVLNRAPVTVPDRRKTRYRMRRKTLFVLHP